MEENREEVIAVLNRLVELELAGAVRYTQYSLMIFGHARIPIMHWMRQQASEALLHATEAGEEITAMGGRVSLAMAELVGHSPHICGRYSAGATGARAQGHRTISKAARAQRGLEHIARGVCPEQDSWRGNAHGGD